MMAPGRSVVDVAEVTRPEDTIPGPSSQPGTATAGSPSLADGGCHVPTPVVLPTALRDARFVDMINDRETLGEIQDSLYTISNGVEDLATTVQDILGLSDSEGSDDEDYTYDVERRVSKFSWMQMKSNARRRRRARLLRNEARPPIQETGAKDDSESDGGDSKKRPEIIPSIRDCNFEQFQSRPSGDSQNVYCADVLIAGDELDKDIIEFRERLTKLKSGELDSWKPGHASHEEPGSELTGKKWIRRIRINSRVVLKILRYLRPKLKGMGNRPVVFYRPFQLLVAAHNELKEQLSNIKEPAAGTSDFGISPKPSDPNMRRSHNLNDQVQKLCDNESSIQELECFVAFMESRVMPDFRRYRDAVSPLPRTIRYEDLWYLFRPGDLVYIPRDVSASQPFRSSPFSQQIVRVIQTCLTGASPLRAIGIDLKQKWSLIVHFIEYDGSSYVPIHYIFPPIPHFSGEKKITDLSAYPISWLENDQVIMQAMSDGATYVSLIERRSGFYSGWTQTVTPYGTRVVDESPEGQFKSPQHVESEILVDFQETFNAFPEWKVKPYRGTVEDEDPNYDNLGLYPDMPLLRYDDSGHKTEDFVGYSLGGDPTELIDAMAFMKQDDLGQFRPHTRKAPTKRFLALLPRRFFAYAVLERKFAPLDIRFVRSADLEANDKAFERLEINRNYKRLILSLVKSHFDKVETEKRTNVEIETQDLIRGKGKGVVILLHGVPGVGKTATAEAVALKWKKPLFPITCGDLGYTAETLEKSLNEIFRLAHHWGCILLLDEADVFITQRERHDLKRNALVSAFLRVLEYYNGIMFLTTNRAGVLDEAVKSRVHLSLYYDHLTEDQTVAIFKQHIQRLRDIEKQRNPNENEQIMVLHKEIIQFAKDHFHQRINSGGSSANLGRWNGRQIRNAFLIASSLAHYDSDGEDDQDEEDDLAETGRKKQKQLGRREFEIVAQTTLMYDHYRQAVHSGKSDDHVAFEREERAMASQPRSPTPDRLKKTSMGFG